MASCATCGTDLAADAKFCTQCGTAAPAKFNPAETIDITLGEAQPAAPQPAAPQPAAPQPAPAPAAEAPTALSGPTVPPTTQQPTYAPAPPPGVGAPPPFPGAGQPAPVGRKQKLQGSWPLPVLTVPIATCIAALLYGLIANVGLANIGFLDELDAAGLGGAVAVFTGVSMVTLYLVALLRRGPAKPLVALLVLLVTPVVAAALLVAVAQVVVGDDGSFDVGLPVGSGDLTTGLPESLWGPYNQMLSTLFDGELAVDVGDSRVSYVLLFGWGLLVGLIGLGGGLGSTGRFGFALMAAIGGFLGAVFGELVVEVLFGYSWGRDIFFGDSGPRVTTLFPALMAGVGIGLGSLIGRAVSKPQPPAA